MARHLQVDAFFISILNFPFSNKGLLLVSFWHSSANPKLYLKARYFHSSNLMFHYLSLLNN
jgi:hypothetical protein